MRRLSFEPVAGFALWLALSLVGPLPAAHAITWSGDIEPNGDPTTWTSSTSPCYVGNTSAGAVTVDSTLGLVSGATYLGYNGGVGGTVAVTGNGTAGSATWAASDALYDGYAGTGSLSISAGGAVSCSGVYLGQNGGTGSASLDGAGSTLTTSGVSYLGSYTAGNNGAGTMTVTNGAVFTSGNSVDLGQTLGAAGKLTIDGAGSAVNESGTSGLNVGYGGSGTLMITNGAVLNTPYSNNIGYNAGSVGSITISGPGSGLIGVAEIPNLGYSGSASLNILNGGAYTALYGAFNGAAGSAASTFTMNVDGTNSLFDTLKTTGTGGINYFGQRGTCLVNITGGGVVKTGTLVYMGQLTGATSTVNVDGAGSQWLINTSAGTSGTLDVGSSGNGVLNISGGAVVESQSVAVSNATSLLSIDVGCGSSLAGGAGSSLANSGVVRVVAGADAAIGAYTPINVSNWSGSGTYQAVGGTWNGGTDQFTVSSVASAAGAGGATASLNASSQQRMLIRDTAAGTSLGVGLLATTSSTPISLTGTTLSGSPLSSLQSAPARRPSGLGRLGDCGYRLHRRHTCLSFGAARGGTYPLRIERGGLQTDQSERVGL